MKNTIKLLFLGVFLFGITATSAQISTSTGGVANVLPNTPTTNTNVGIGTTDPKAKLHIFAQENGAFNGLVVDNRKIYGVGSGISQTSRIVLSLTENAAPNPLDRIFGIIESGTLSESSSTDGRLSFYVRQGGTVNEKLRINSIGDVGIGTTSPTAKLEVNGNTKINGVLNVTGTNALNFSTFGGGIYMSDTSWIRTSGNKNFYHNAGIMRTDGLFHVGPNGDRLVVNTNGFVGIGTATPSAKLDVNGNIAVGGLSAGSDASPLSKKIAAYNYQSIEAGAIDFLDFNTNRHATSIAFRAKNASNAPQEFMRIVGQDGNVGIGTTNPVGKLDVNGSIFLKGKSILDSDGISSYFNSGAASYFQNMGTVSATITSSGNFGIGTTNPDEKLTVKGKIHAEEIKVDLAVPADYVFQKYYTGKSELKSDYAMPTLAEIESFTKKNHHLPNMPSAQEIKQKGVSLGEMSNVLLQKIEELTLYAIEQQKELDRLKTENANYKSLAERLSAIEKKLKK